LGIACLSAAPLAGTRSGWGYFYQEGMDSVYLRDLTLTNWTHYIHIGYNEVRMVIDTCKLWGDVQSVQDVS
jgi:hypothetical protein